MHGTTSDDPADLKVKAKEKTYISAAPTNLCQGKTTMFLHWPQGWDLLKKGHLHRF